MRLVRRANDEINETNPRESPKWQNIYIANRTCQGTVVQDVLKK